MICNNCKKEIEDGKFCPYCGMKQEQNGSVTNTAKKETSIVEEFPTNPSRKNLSSGKIIIAVAISFVVFLCLFLCLGKSKSEKFLDMVKDGKTEQALTYYQEKLTEDEKALQEVYREVTGTIELLVNNYADDVISYDDAVNGLNVYSRFYSMETNNALQEIDKLRNSKESFAFAEEKFLQEDYYQAYYEYSKVIPKDHNSESAEKKAEECYNLIREKVFSQAELNVKEGDYSQAIETLQNDLTFFKIEDTDAVNKRIDEYINMYLDDEMVKFDQSLEKGEYENCFKLLDEMMLVVKNDNKRIDEAEELLHKSYENYIQTKFFSGLNELNLEVCENSIQEGMSLMPNNEVFLGLQSTLQNYYPVNLFEVDPFQESTYFQSEARSVLDNQGNEHQLAYTCGGIYIVHADWKLDKKYNILTGMVGVPSGDYETGVNGEIILYGDGNVLWEKKGIDASNAPENISVDVTGVDVLQIYMKGGSGPLKFCSVMVADFVVQKKQ